jgi:hypothetical protein
MAKKRMVRSRAKALASKLPGGSGIMGLGFVHRTVLETGVQLTIAARAVPS